MASEAQAQDATQPIEAKAKPVERRMPWVLPAGGKLTVRSPGVVGKCLGVGTADCAKEAHLKTFLP